MVLSHLTLRLKILWVGVDAKPEEFFRFTREYRYGSAAVFVGALVVQERVGDIGGGPCGVGAEAGRPLDCAGQAAMAFAAAVVQREIGPDHHGPLRGVVGRRGVEAHEILQEVGESIVIGVRRGCGVGESAGPLTECGGGDAENTRDIIEVVVGGIECAPSGSGWRDFVSAGGGVGVGAAAGGEGDRADGFVAAESAGGKGGGAERERVAEGLGAVSGYDGEELWTDGAGGNGEAR